MTSSIHLYTVIYNNNVYSTLDFPGGSVVKNPPASAGDTGLILGSGRSLGEGNGNSLQYQSIGSQKSYTELSN